MYTRRLTIDAARERVFGAIATLDGPRHWQIVMRVDEVRPPLAVGWSCVAHTRGEEWTGTHIRFELAERGPRVCDLDFRHAGISADLVAAGWERFLASLAAYAGHGEGAPFGR
jgi:hypothetical protein